MKQYIKHEIRDLLIDILSINRELNKVTLSKSKKHQLVVEDSSNNVETEFNLDRTQIEEYQKQIQTKKQKNYTFRFIWNLINGSSYSNLKSRLNYINLETFEKNFAIDTFISDQELTDCFYLIDTILDELEYKLDKLLFSLIVVPKIEYRKTRLIPRSIPRTFERFFDELKLTAENKYINEFYLSRNQIWIATKSFLILLLTPLIITWIIKNFCIEPLVTFEWNQYQTNLFLNHQQEQYALEELKNFEDQIYFEELVRVSDQSNSLINRDLTKLGPIEVVQNVKNKESESDILLQLKSDKIFDPIKDDEKIAVQRIEAKMFELAKEYNKQSIQLITNLIGDVITLSTLILLIQPFKKEIRIIRSVLGEILYSLNDTTKSFVIILMTDLLVGFHSPKGWDILIQATLDHFALPQNEDFVFLCVATFPVLLDTAFKYWIFRYLNRLSPSTVVTYHNIIE